MPGRLAVGERHIGPGAMEATTGRESPCAWRCASRTAKPRAIEKIRTTWDKRATSIEMAGRVSQRTALGAVVV